MSVQLREAAMVVLGLTLAVAPLALWVAWSQFVFLTILAVSLAAMVLIMVLARAGEPADGVPPPQQARGAAADPRFIGERHRIMPLPYHHGQRGSPRFRRVMARLRAMMEPEQD